MVPSPCSNGHYHVRIPLLSSSAGAPPSGPPESPEPVTTSEVKVITGVYMPTPQTCVFITGSHGVDTGTVVCFGMLSLAILACSGSICLFWLALAILACSGSICLLWLALAILACSGYIGLLWLYWLVVAILACFGMIWLVVAKSDNASLTMLV